MTNSIKSTLLITFLAVLGFASCKNAAGTSFKTDVALNTIPNDVTSVSSVNIKNIMDKMDFEAVKKMEFYQRAVKEATEENRALGAVLANPASSGIDLSGNVYSSMYFDPNNTDDMFNAFVAPISDRGAFQAMLKEAGAGTFEEKGDYTLVKPDRKVSIAWDDNKVVMGTSSSYYGDPSKGIQKFFATTSETSIAKNTSLQKTLGSGHDINSWLSGDAIADNPLVKMGLGMAQIPEDALKGNVVSSFIDFNNGAIVGKSDYDLNKDLTADINKLFKDEVKTDFSAYIPKENLLFYMTNAINFDGIDDVLSKQQMGKFYVENALKEYGVSLSDIIKTFGGDIVVAATAVNGDDKPKLIFGTDIKDMSLLNKFIAAASDVGMLNKVSDTEYSLSDKMQGGDGIDFADGRARLIIEDSKVFVTGAQSVAKTILGGGYSRGNRVSSKASKVGGNIFGMFLDFNALKRMDIEGTDLSALNNAEITVGRRASDFNVDLLDDSKNSLKAIFEMINKAYLKNKDKINVEFGEEKMEGEAI